MQELTTKQLQEEQGGIFIELLAGYATYRVLRAVYQAGYDAHNNNCGCPQ
ncbi:MAG: hypothetical protein AAF433_19320 [Bacteroidota bacterium]